MSTSAKAKPGLALSILKPQIELFVLEYLKDFNGTRAYKASHPNCRSDKAAATEAWRYLRKPEIAARIDAGEKAQHARLRMEGEEALARISQVARADITELFDDRGHLLPVSLWPQGLRRCVKSIKQTEFGLAVQLHDSLRAQELMAQAAGVLKMEVKHSGRITLEDVLDASRSPEARALLKAGKVAR
jgi:hypothetical protein